MTSRRDQLYQAGLNRAVKVGAVWVGVERFMTQLLNILSSVVLARLLSPSDFGLVGMAAVFTGVSSRLAHFGFGAAAIRMKELRPDHLPTLFTITLGINTGITVVLMLVAPLAGSYFHQPIVTDILRVMSLNFLIRCIGVCPSVILRRQLDFRTWTTAAFLDHSVKLSITAGMALGGFGVWSLVWGELAGGLLEKLYMAYVARWKPAVGFTRLAFKELWRFGFNMTLKQTLVYFSENVDNLVVGKMLGAAALGFYEKSYRLMNLPVAEISGRLNTVLIPAFARIQDEPGRLRAATRKTLLSLSLIGYPLFTALVVAAPVVIGIMLGPQWTSAVLPFQLLCLAGPPRMLAGVIGSLLNAGGHIAVEVRRRAVVLVMLLAGTWLGARWGIAGVAAGVTAVNWLGAAMLVLVATRLLPLTLDDVLGPQRLPFLATGALAVTSTALAWWLGVLGWTEYVRLPVAAGSGLLVYAGVLFLFADTPLERLATEMKQDLRSVRRKLEPGSRS
jgi:PST family polysaccharide transporter